jgi:hypothetical protein
VSAPAGEDDCSRLACSGEAGETSLLRVSTCPGDYAARAVVKEIEPWLAPSDPHFVGEFQFKFDQRLIGASLGGVS